MDKKRLHNVVRERDICIEKLAQARKAIIRLEALQNRIQKQEAELTTARHTVTNEIARIAALDKKLVAAAD